MVCRETLITVDLELEHTERLQLAFCVWYGKHPHFNRCTIVPKTLILALIMFQVNPTSLVGDCLYSAGSLQTATIAVT